MKHVFAKTSRSILLICIQISVFPVAGQAAGTVVGWGWDGYGQTTIPSGLNDVVAIAAGELHNLALTAEGRVVAWGSGDYGLTMIPTGLSNVVAIAVGYRHSLALTAEGGVVAWGVNNYGQTNIPPGLSNVVAITAGQDHSLALTGEGQVVGWGYSGYQTIIPNGLSNVVALAAGERHSLALTAEGRVVGWGWDDYDQTNIPGALDNVVAIAAGQYHSLALTAEGQVVSWGWNEDGQTNIPTGLSNVVAITAGYRHSLAMKEDGTVVAWGANDGGQSTVPSGLSNVVGIAGGAAHSVALKSDGTPAVLVQPVSQMVSMGATVAFTPKAAGAPPLHYQWRKDAAPIPDATNSIYTLTGVTTNDTGNFNLVVSNGFGSAGSSRAALQVLPYGAPSIRVNNQLAAGTVSAPFPATVSITGGFTSGFIFYTLDGTTPNLGSLFYNGPFSLTNNVTLLAMSVSADFALVSVAPAVTVLGLPTYSLHISVLGSGRIGVSPSRNSYPSNSIVRLTAYPGVRNAFDHWSGDLTGSANPATLTMNRPCSVQAAFTSDAYPLTLSVPGGGTVTADGRSIAPGTYYPSGTLVSLAASADSGWSFLRWEGSINSTNNPLLLAMNQSQNMQGIFGTVVRTAVAGVGTIVLSLDNPVPYGALVTATAVPGPGSSFLVWSGAGSGTTNPTTFTVTNATPMIGAIFTGPATPTILAQPTNTTVLLGETARLTVTVGGATPLSYQWRKGTNSMMDATNSTYTITSTVVADAGDYDVVVSNQYGSLTSAVAVLTVVIPPFITVQPVSQTVEVGSIVTLSVVAGGTEPLSYQWQDEAGIIHAATNAEYVLNPALTNHAGNYDVVVTNPYGAVTSAVATVTVFIPVAITTPPLTQVVAARETATFSVGATGFPAPDYQWLFIGEALSGANASALVITNVGTNDLGAYQVVVWNAHSAATSSPAMLIMSPSLRAPFMGTTAIWGKPATLFVSAVGSGPLSYQWFKDGAPVTGGTNDTLGFTAVQIDDGGLYSVVVSSPWGSVTNAPAQLVVNPANIGLGLYAGVTIEGVAGYTYEIQYTTDLRDTNSWVTVTNLTLSEPVELWVDRSVDVHSMGNAKRYYRVVGR